MQTTKLVVVTCLLSLSSSCATTHQGRAIQLVVASDAAADEVADRYKMFVDERVASCDKQLDPEKDTKADAVTCLGLASSENGTKLKAIIEILVAAQLAIKIAVECDVNPLKLPDKFREQCVDAKKADWLLLAKQVANAWDDLRPYFEAVKEASP